MKVLTVLLALLSVTHAAAAEWFCQTGLEQGDPPQSALAFRLVLGPDGGFQAEGRRHGRGFGWSGHYTEYDAQLAMIGALQAGPTPVEARALSRRMQEDVLILSLHEAETHMVRCLRHDLR